MKRRMRARRTTVAAAAAVISLALGGCSVEPNAPDMVRFQAGVAQGRAADAKAAADAKNSGKPDCRVAKCIALTFDGGPGRDTPKLLDILKEEKVPATFFLLGEKHVLRHPDVVRRMHREGHELANHTWTHRILIHFTEEEVRSELSRTQDAIRQVSGVTPTLMRPPQGRTNPMVTGVARELGLTQVLWNATARDYSTTDPALIESRILAQAERDGIILLHDIYGGTVPSVPGIVAKLRKRGYTFVTVPQMIAPAVAQPGQVLRPTY
ncbi:polysaccharide deacetylase family protein [Streptomyces sp. NPDC048442]|uniref:polysaccharide deacetylase family protein n=1 Tax=Streptomyces sp. NPDC048442 TaxID=3154823 RepID=UPI0034445B7B